MVKLPMLVGWSDPAHIGSRTNAAATSTRTIFMNQCTAVVVEALLLLPSTVLYMCACCQQLASGERILLWTGFLWPPVNTNTFSVHFYFGDHHTRLQAAAAAPNASHTLYASLLPPPQFVQSKSQPCRAAIAIRYRWTFPMHVLQKCRFTRGLCCLCASTTAATTASPAARTGSSSSSTRTKGSS